MLGVQWKPFLSTLISFNVDRIEDRPGLAGLLIADADGPELPRNQAAVLIVRS